MKVLYIGYYKENSDWGTLAVNNILALESAGVDVVCRPIIFSNNETPIKIKDLEKKSTEGCDVCIQHVFPDHMVSSESFTKNIAILSNDFFEINHSCWVEKLNRMGEIWVPSTAAAETLKATPLSHKTTVVPFAIDIDLYKGQSSQNIEGGIESIGKFKFYTISDTDNNNIDRLLRCFHSEFDNTDDAVFAIQINSNNTKNLDERIARVKNSLGLNKDVLSYKRDIIVAKRDSAVNSFAMHSFGDCYISSLSQRTLNLEEIHAMGFGNTPIISGGTDAVDYFGNKYAVDYIYTVNTEKSKIYPDVNNGRDYKILPCEKQLKAMMRRLYEEWKTNPILYKAKKRSEGLERLSTFSIENVGKIMKENINV
jgi:hypothetical protein